MMNATKVTVSLPTELLRDVERIASERDVSLDTLMAETLSHLIQSEADYAAAKANYLSIMAENFDLGTHGKLGPRDDLHKQY